MLILLCESLGRESFNLHLILQPETVTNYSESLLCTQTQ